LRLSGIASFPHGGIDGKLHQYNGPSYSPFR